MFSLYCHSLSLSPLISSDSSRYGTVPLKTERLQSFRLGSHGIILPSTFRSWMRNSSEDSTLISRFYSRYRYRNRQFNYLTRNFAHSCCFSFQKLGKSGKIFLSCSSRRHEDRTISSPPLLAGLAYSLWGFEKSWNFPFIHFLNQYGYWFHSFLFKMNFLFHFFKNFNKNKKIIRFGCP